MNSLMMLVSELRQHALEVSRLTAAVDRLVATRNARPPSVPTNKLRNVYTAEQFAAEILCGNRTVDWVQEQCRAKKIKWVVRKPWLIPQSEALRFIASQSK